MNRNKILVVFVRNGQEVSASKVECLKELFQLQYKNNENIVKELIWETKYYYATYGLYIDETDSLEQWIKEFGSGDCEILKSVLAGILIIDTQDVAVEQLQLLSDIMKDTNAFLIWSSMLHNTEDIDTGCEVEIVNWRDNNTDIYGEKRGVERIREIIDVYRWSTMTLKSRASSLLLLEQLLNDDLQI